jgi:hypothetical protein
LAERIPHLTRRFFGSLRAKPLTPTEADFVAGMLPRPAGELFWQQPLIDQRHALESAKLIAQATDDRPDLTISMLLHDIGKRHARLGVAMRVIATLFLLFRIPAPGRIRSYLDHGELAASELEAIGFAGVVVSFARNHAHGRPADIAPADWALLLAADAEKLRPDTGRQYDDTS